MSDLAWRLIILGLVAAAILFAVWRSNRAKRALPSRVVRPDLGPGVHFFSSATCAPCADAREVLRSAYGENVREVRFEDHPTGFGAFGVGSVPTVFVLDSEGAGIRIEGVPAQHQLPTLGWEGAPT